MRRWSLLRQGMFSRWCSGNNSYSIFTLQIQDVVSGPSSGSILSASSWTCSVYSCFSTLEFSIPSARRPDTGPCPCLFQVFVQRTPSQGGYTYLLSLLYFFHSIITIPQMDRLIDCMFCLCIWFIVCPSTTRLQAPPGQRFLSDLVVAACPVSKTKELLQLEWMNEWCSAICLLRGNGWCVCSLGSFAWFCFIKWHAWVTWKLSYAVACKCIHSWFSFNKPGTNPAFTELSLMGELDKCMSNSSKVGSQSW